MVLLLLFGFLGFANSLALDNLGEAEQINEGILGISDTVTNKDISSEYLKQEWTKILDTTGWGKVVLAIYNFIKVFDPLFKAVLGMEFSLTLGFALAIMFWIIIFMLIYQPVNIIFQKKWFAILGAVVITCIIGVSGVIRGAVNMLSSVLTSQLLIVICFVVTIIVLILFSLFGKIFKKYFEKQKEEEEKDREARDRALLHAQAENVQKQVDDYPM